MHPKPLLLPGLLAALLAPAVASAQSSFGPATAYPTGHSGAYAVATADVDGDGRPDLATANSTDNTVSVLLNQAAAPGTFGAPTTYFSGGAQTSGVMLGDVNGDNRPDLVLVNSGNATVSVLLNSATAPGTFASATSYSTGGNSYFGVLADLNGDGRLDIGVAVAYSSGNSSGNSVGVLLNSATTPGTFGAVALYPSGPSPIGLAVGDLNGDNRPDLATGNFGSTTVSVLLNQAATPGTFGAPTTYPSGGNQPVGVVIADLNRDGRLDLAVANLGSGTVGVLLNQGTGTGALGPTTTYDTGGTSPNLVAVTDVNGDGRPDLVTSNQTTNTVSVLTGKAALGTFAATTYPDSGGPLGIAVADFNGDSRPDIASAHNTAPTVGVLLNTYQYLAATPATTPADFTLYPNPAHDRCTLSVPAGLAGAAQAELLDALGTVVRRQAAVLPAAASQLVFEAAGIAPGAYTLRLRAGGQVLVRRVLLR